MGVEMGRGLLRRAQTLLLRLSLHNRIAVVMSAILIAVSLAFGYIGMESLGRSTQAMLDERRSTAILVARHLDDYVEDAGHHVQAIADEFRDRPGVFEQGDSRQTIIAEAFSQNRHLFSHLLIFDDRGGLVASAPVAGTVTPDTQIMVLLQESLRSREPIVSNKIRLPVTGTAGVLFIAPIVEGSKLLGAAVGEVVLPHAALSSIADSLKLGKSGHLEVVDGDGWVLSSTFENVVGQQTEHPEFYVPALLSRRTSVGRALHYSVRGVRQASDNEFHVMAFAPLANAPWGVGLGQIETETYAPIADLRNRAIAMSAGALLVALFVTWLGTLSVVRPIRLLTKAGERMATGDLSEPINIVQPDEVGRLADAFEIMRQRLGQSVAEIKAWNRELEERVHDRTRELESSNRHLQSLMAVATSISKANDRQQVLTMALQEFGETLGVRASWAMLWDEERDSLRLAAAYPPSSKDTSASVTASADQCCCTTLLTSAGVCPASEECLCLTACGLTAQLGARCWCTPLKVGDNVLGVLCLALESERVLENEDIALVDGVAQQVAVFFEKARLTDERARLEAGRRMERLRAEFLASVSHELRTPLGFIKGYTTTLLRDDVTWKTDDQREFLRIIDEESDRLTSLVDSLLDVAREQAGRLRMRYELVTLQQVVRQSLDRMARSLDPHRIELHMEALPDIVADGGRLEQVIVNLLQNAAKYSSDGSPVTVELASRDDGVLISVLDRGVGVPLSELGHIFEPFYRVANGSTVTAGGAGLGLTICRAIVEAHGGRIWAEARPGGGTAVHFTLPLAPLEEEGQNDEQ